MILSRILVKYCLIVFRFGQVALITSTDLSIEAETRRYSVRWYKSDHKCQKVRGPNIGQHEISGTGCKLKVPSEQVDFNDLTL